MNFLPRVCLVGPGIKQPVVVHWLSTQSGVIPIWSRSPEYAADTMETIGVSQLTFQGVGTWKSLEEGKERGFHG